MLELHSLGAGFTPELPATFCSYSILSWVCFWFGLGLGCLRFSFVLFFGFFWWPFWFFCFLGFLFCRFLIEVHASGTYFQNYSKNQTLQQRTICNRPKARLLFLMLILFLALHSDAPHVWSTYKNEISMTFRLQNPFCLSRMQLYKWQ